MPGWRQQLRDDLTRLDKLALRRRLRPVEPTGRKVRLDGRELINLASNDYLALSQHPHLQAAAIQAVKDAGTGAGASRLVSGHTPLHALAEERFARFKHAQAALLCPTGYLASQAVLTCLAGDGDLICLDKLNHASLIDAARATAATVRVYPHLNLAKLERLLGRHHKAQLQARRLIVTDSVFSMDGDTADLPALCDLAQRYDAITVVDEAHGTGVLGPTGAGLAELQGVADRVDVTVSTASKALGGLGGVVTSYREVIDTLVNHARSFIYTTAVPPAQAAAIIAALEVLEAEPQRRQRLGELAAAFAERLAELGLREVDRADVVTPIFPIVVGGEQAALDLAAHLCEAGFFAPAIRPPTVAPGGARVRLALRCDLEDAELTRLVEALRAWIKPGC